jgi:hypothetical protein
LKHANGDAYPLGGVRLLLKDECEKFGGLRAWGRAHRITAAHVSRVIAGQSMPGPRVLKALKLRESTVYVPTSTANEGQS